MFNPYSLSWQILVSYPIKIFFFKLWGMTFLCFFRLRGWMWHSTGFQHWLLYRCGFKARVCFLLTIYLGQSSRLWLTFFFSCLRKRYCHPSCWNLEIIFDFSFPFTFHIPQIRRFSRIYVTNISQIHSLLTYADYFSSDLHCFLTSWMQQLFRRYICLHSCLLKYIFPETAKMIFQKYKSDFITALCLPHNDLL